MEISSYLFNILCKVQRLIKRTSEFENSSDYWIKRYKRGKTSGKGSYGELANFKAEVLNTFVLQKEIHTVIEFGCGDGNQLRYSKYPQYLGFDISPKAIKKCEMLFAGDTTKSFCLVNKYTGQKAELALSLDVIYHLIEDHVFESYMATLFNAAEKYVIVYSSNKDENPADLSPHVQHRLFTHWISKNQPGWELLEIIPNKYPVGVDSEEGSFADFYIFSKHTENTGDT